MSTFTNIRISEDGHCMAGQDQYGQWHIWHRRHADEDWEYGSAYPEIPEWFG